MGYERYPRSSNFGDHDRCAEDSDYPRTSAGGRGDADHHHWRSGQIAALDRDYDEYRSENRAKFSDNFASWRTEREGQRGSLSKVAEHMDVVGSDGAHVGTVQGARRPHHRNLEKTMGETRCRAPGA